MCSSTCYTTAAGSVRSPRWPGCDGVTGQLDDVRIGECFVLDGAENMGGTVIAYSVLHHHNDGDIATEGCVASCDYRGRLCRSGDGLLCSDDILAMGATTTDYDELDCVHGDDTKICELAEDCVGSGLERHEARLVYSTTAEIVGLTKLGASTVAPTNSIGFWVEPTNSIGFWDGGERWYPSVSWETYALCSYVWGRVRSILLAARLLVLNTSGNLPKESWGTKFSAPRRRRAGNAYVMTSSVERVEVLAGVLIVLSISYGKVSTAEVMVEVDSIDQLSCGAGVAADARACVYRLYGVERRRETRMEEVEA